MDIPTPDERKPKTWRKHAARRHLHNNLLRLLSERQGMVNRSWCLLQRGGRHRRRRGAADTGGALGGAKDGAADIRRRRACRRVLGTGGARRRREIHAAPQHSRGVSLRRALLPLLCATIGCTSAPVTTRADVDPNLKLAALVLTPVRDTAGEDTSALGQRLTAVALEAVAGEALVWAGAEVHVLHPGRRDWTATSAVPLLRAAGIRLEEAVVVEAQVDSGQAATQQEVQGKSGGSAVGAAAELHWRAMVEVLQPSTGQTLVETSAEARADPFSRGGTDATTTQPAAVLERALSDALARLRGRWTPPRPPRGPALVTFTVVPTPEGRLAHGLDAEVLRLQ